MSRASTAKAHTAPPSLETILKRADDVKRGKVQGRTRKEITSLWAKDRRKAVARAQEAKRSIQ
jgi:hypothetical protein